MWRKISRQAACVEVWKKGKMRNARRWGKKERRTACERRRTLRMRERWLGRWWGGETRRLVGVGCAKDIAECI